MQKIMKLLAAIIMLIGLTSGCINIKDGSFLNPKPAADTYFHRGVYKSYSPDKNYLNKNYFYIFYDENSGHTEESEKGIGLAFSCVQKNGTVEFKFGGVKEPEKIFKIKSVKNGVITGSFEDGLLLKFDFIPNTNPDNFDAVNYTKNKNIFDANRL